MWMGKEGVSIGRSQFVQLKLDETDPATTGQYTIEVVVLGGIHYRLDTSSVGVFLVSFSSLTDYLLPRIEALNNKERDLHFPSFCYCGWHGQKELEVGLRHQLGM